MNYREQYEKETGHILPICDPRLKSYLDLYMEYLETRLSKCEKERDALRGRVFVDELFVERLRVEFDAVPCGAGEGYNRYDTDDKRVIHLWSQGKSYDITIARELRKQAGMEEK